MSPFSAGTSPSSLYLLSFPKTKKSVVWASSHLLLLINSFVGTIFIHLKEAPVLSLLLSTLSLNSYSHSPFKSIKRLACSRCSPLSSFSIYPHFRHCPLVFLHFIHVSKFFSSSITAKKSVHNDSKTLDNPVALLFFSLPIHIPLRPAYLLNQHLVLKSFGREKRPSKPGSEGRGVGLLVLFQCVLSPSQFSLWFFFGLCLVQEDIG